MKKVFLCWSPSQEYAVLRLISPFLSCFSLLIFEKTSMDNFFYSLFPVSGHMCNMLNSKDFQLTKILRMTHSHQALIKNKCLANRIVEMQESH